MMIFSYLPKENLISLMILIINIQTKLVLLWKYTIYIYNSNLSMITKECQQQQCQVSTVPISNRKLLLYFSAHVQEAFPRLVISRRHSLIKNTESWYRIYWTCAVTFVCLQIIKIGGKIPFFWWNGFNSKISRKYI